jgi:hypothetical protein
VLRRHRPPSKPLATVAGALLAVLRLSLTDPDFDDDAVYVQLAEQLLRMLGIPRPRRTGWPTRHCPTRPNPIPPASGDRRGRPFDAQRRQATLNRPSQPVKAA